MRWGSASSPSSSDRVRGNGLKLCRGRFGLDIRKNFSEGAVRRWYRLPDEEVKSLPLEVFNNHGDVALRDNVRV